MHPKYKKLSECHAPSQVSLDRGYMTVTPDHHVEVSRRVKEEFDNGEEYAVFHGHRLITLPELATDQPRREYLQ